MALDWIKIEHTLPDKPEVIGVADAVNLDPDEVVGKLIRLWIWADQQSRDGHAKNVTLSWIDRHIRVTGFADALVAVGWLEANGSGVTIPNYDRHLSQNAKSRGDALIRKRNQRAKNVTQTSRAKRDKVVTREKSIENREKSNKETPLPPLPSELDTDEFRSAWAKWISHRKEIRKPLTPTCTEQQLKRLAGWGVTRAVAALEHTISNGWQGIREPDRQHERQAPARSWDDVIREASDGTN